jgi:hypothetical protein
MFISIITEYASRFSYLHCSYTEIFFDDFLQINSYTNLMLDKSAK